MILKMRYFVVQITVLLALVMHFSCSRPSCESANPIYQHNSFYSEQYKKELAHDITLIGDSNLRYWLYAYKIHDGTEYMIVSVQGRELCAKMPVKVLLWDNKIKSIQERKGASYRGARFADFEFDILKEGDVTHFIYRGMDHIVD
jgi:hypothetical protein